MNRIFNLNFGHHKCYNDKKCFVFLELNIDDRILKYPYNASFYIEKGVFNLLGFRR